MPTLAAQAIVIRFARVQALKGINREVAAGLFFVLHLHAFVGACDNTLQLQLPRLDKAER